MQKQEKLKASHNYIIFVIFTIKCEIMPINLLHSDELHGTIYKNKSASADSERR